MCSSTYLKQAIKEYEKYKRTRKNIYLAQAGEKLYATFKVFMKEILGIEDKTTYEVFRKELNKFIHYLGEKADKENIWLIRDIYALKYKTHYLHIYFNEGYFDDIKEYRENIKEVIETFERLFKQKERLRRYARAFREGR